MQSIRAYISANCHSQGIDVVAKKREVRKSIQQNGWITLEGGFAGRPCRVLDLSQSGAKIVVEDTSLLTAKLRFGLSREAKNAKACQIVWRRGQTVGIRFTNARRS